MVHADHRSTSANSPSDVLGYCLICSHALTRNASSRCLECGRAFRQEDRKSFSSIPLHRYIKFVIGSSYALMVIVALFTVWMAWLSLSFGDMYVYGGLFAALGVMALAVVLPPLLYGLWVIRRLRTALLLVAVVFFSTGSMLTIWIWQLPIRIHFALVHSKMESIADHVAKGGTFQPTSAGLWKIDSTRTDQSGVVYVSLGMNLLLIREDRKNGVVFHPWGNIVRIIPIDDQWSIVIDD